MLVILRVLRMLVPMDQALGKTSPARVVVVVHQMHPCPGQLGEDYRCDQKGCEREQLPQRHAGIVAHRSRGVKAGRFRCTPWRGTQFPESAYP